MRRQQRVLDAELIEHIVVCVIPAAALIDPQVVVPVCEVEHGSRQKVKTDILACPVGRPVSARLYGSALNKVKDLCRSTEMSYTVRGNGEVSVCQSADSVTEIGVDLEHPGSVCPTGCQFPGNLFRCSCIAVFTAVAAASCKQCQ